jgi:glycine cleavage system H lipoate-binding protein/ABC-type phosphate transport system substrate-binding protein
MKKAACILLSVFLLSHNLESRNIQTGTNQHPKDSVNILAGRDLFAISSVWAAEYKKLNPEAEVSVRVLSQSTFQNRLLGTRNIGIVSGKEISFFEGESVLTAVAGRDVIVPVINSDNPFIDELRKHGISPSQLGRLIIGSEKPAWGKLLENNEKSSLTLYMESDNLIQESIFTFLNTGVADVQWIKTVTGNEMIAAIQKDPLAIGFCKMLSVVEFADQKLADNICLLPIDRNENGIIDSNEDIYSDLNSFSRGVWIGKYPKSLINNVYTVSANTNQNEVVASFLKWVLTDGQQYLNSIGYSDLLASERQSTLDKINNTMIIGAAAPEEKSIFKSALIILAVLIIAVICIDFLLRFVRNRKSSIKNAVLTVRSILNEKTLIIPKGLYFDKTHTWAFMEQNGVIKVGIDDFLQHITGSITRIKMRKPGDELKKGDAIMSVVHNGKQLNLYAPVSGKIIEQNKNLEGNASLINTSPYSDGWVYRIEPSNWPRENQLLFMADKQKQFIINEFTRLKDFLAGSLKDDSEMYSQVVLQDGGELMDGLLSDLGPEVWEDFQTKFIDPSRQLWFYEMY